ncbi:unnamed protein product [Caenorhabditis bovis]|uniref:Rap-GAP domain-containing protein n=1 Tax=Caenorhabditis bovis TaxID=2654633 RepID=A0A8S1F0B5_9PELO|nr:unnamed protein product [Caenorhabditis bovis]
MENSDPPVLVSASYDQTIKIWNVSRKKALATIQHNEGQVNCLSLTSNGRDLALGAYQRIRIYDVHVSKDPKATIDLHKNVTVIGFELTGRWMYTGGEDGVCRIWEMRSNQLVANRTIWFAPAQVTAMTTNVTQTEMFVATNAGQVCIWDIINNCYQKFPMPDNLGLLECVQKLSVHPTGKRLAGITNRGRLLTWDILTRKLDEVPPMLDYKTPTMATESPTSTYGILREKDPICKLPKGYGLSCRYSPDGKYLVACGTDSVIHVLNADSMKHAATLNAECDWNWDAIFTADGRHILTGGSDGRIKVWDTTTASKVLQLEGHSKPITAIVNSTAATEMFARKGKSSDIQASIARFTDLNRDCVSRVKHLKILLDTLTTNEKRQLLDEHSFETFHLVDELLLVNDVSTQIDSAIEAESGLWTLEQVLCLAPELVGSGWQRHAIESLLKKAVFPRNLMAVRKIAIRLFLVFYQCLGVHGKATPDLDHVFQSLLPFFPLRSGENTEDVLNEYCQSSGTGDWCERLRKGPIRSSAPSTLSSKERAQMLQVYLDKFLEYCTRETARIEWNDEGKRLECANFIIEKVIKLYMGECFDELEANGVDIFGGWEGAESSGEPLDTADPVATNVTLTLMREAMTLPLACSNVTHKVVNLLSTWLLQYEIPPFVASGEVSIERFSLLCANILLSFFHSPYLAQSGERLQSAVSIAYAILTSCKQLVSQRIQLPKPLPQKFWAELMSGLCRCATKICSQNDAFSQQVASAFTSTLISNVVIIKAVRRIEIEDEVWDDVYNVMNKGAWISMSEQWSTIVNSVTRALILHLAHVDIFSREEAMRKVTDVSQASSRRQAIESAMEEPRKESSEGGESMGSAVEDNVFHDTDDITNAVTSWSGDKLAWLQTWRRVISLVDPYSKPSAQVAIECTSVTIRQLLNVNLHPLAHWLACRLVTVPPELLPKCVPALSAILSDFAIRRPPPLLSANILLCFIRLMQSKDTSVIPAICGLSAQELSIVAPRALEHIPKILQAARSSKDQKMVTSSLKLFAMLASSYPGAEQLLLDQLASADISENAIIIVNTLAILIVQRAQIDLVLTVLKAIETHQFAMKLIPLFCSSIASLAQFSSTTLLQALLRAASLLRDERARTEVEWQMVRLCVQWPQPQVPLVVRGILADRQLVLQGELITLGGQFPLKGFEVARWNSTEASSKAVSLDPNSEKNVYVNRNSSIISISKKANEVVCRTVVGRHVWELDLLNEERKPAKNVTSWLRKEANKGRRAGRENQGILGAMDDPFDELPDSSGASSFGEHPSPLEGSGQFLTMIETCRRQPQPLGKNSSGIETPAFRPSSKLLEWRSLAASLGFVPSVSSVHQNFLRDLKHLDSTSSREVHKIAVIYVGEGQDDRSSILSNQNASEAFDEFVSELGWEVKIGRGHEGYHGGLPVDTRAPYYADAESEVIFHVNTMLNGDVHSKWKHIGNDEVHVVWTENRRKAYTRETIATKFCDVLIVLEQVGDKMVRVRVDTASALEFGPLFDGAFISLSELANLVRLTVINASRSMNILHHKSWHVRTKANMERVRRDERKAAEEEQRRLDRQIQAENERRMNLLRARADEKLDKMFGVPGTSTNTQISDSTGHVNLFQDLEREERKNLGTGNKEYEEEKAKEKREWESKMGIQVYFADNTNELEKKKEWYESLPMRRAPDKTEKPKVKEDFLMARARLEEENAKKGKKRKRSRGESEEREHKRKKKKKSKKKKRKRDSSEEREIEELYKSEKRRKLEELRDARLKRERMEAARTHALLHPPKKEEENKKRPNRMAIKYPRKIWIVRHAEREDNINRGWRNLPEAKGLTRDNSILSARGRKQAAECQVRFKNQKIDHVFSSPFDRTIETASIIVGDKGLKVKAEGGLCEALYLCESPPGFWETDKLADKFPLVDRDYIPVYSKYTLPKEGDGDDACVDRVRTTLKRIFEKYEGNLLLVGHGASIGACHEVLHGDFKYVGQATVTEFEETAPGKYKMNYSSDASHLSDKSNLRPWKANEDDTAVCCPTCRVFNTSNIIYNIQKDHNVDDFAICSNCAIISHLKKKHTVVDFFPIRIEWSFSQDIFCANELKKQLDEKLAKLQNDMGSTMSLSSINISLHDKILNFMRRSKNGVIYRKLWFKFLEEMKKLETFLSKFEEMVKNTNQEYEKTLDELKNEVDIIEFEDCDVSEPVIANCVLSPIYNESEKAAENDLWMEYQDAQYVNYLA